ncbi:MAG: glycine cleavage system protein GcvH [Thermoproteota archaeon]
MVEIDEYEVPEDLYYTEDWAWIKVEGDLVRVGLTDYAQKQLREVVYAELPEAGMEVEQGEPYGTVESVKAVSDLTAPINGTVEEVNDEIQASPEILNEDPYGEGWLVVIKPSNLEADLEKTMNFDEAVEWHKEMIEEG